MLFNSLTFGIFLPVVFACYWLLANKPLLWQNLLLLAASYLFYGWWDWRFLSLLFLSSSVDYTLGRLMGGATEGRQRKFLLGASLAFNLGLLGFFKYYNFFMDSLMTLGQQAGLSFHASSLRVILPIGISFYTFQSLSYTIDVYRRQIPAARGYIDFLAYVSFFPQLVAGPIQRGTNLLPQFYRPRHFDRSAATDGLRQMLWGFYKKMVIADNAALIVNRVFAAPDTVPASGRLVALVLFAFQIYGDFSGYSDIAIGCARLFGFDLQRNFANPYFSRDIAEFWRRWHISLTSWFRDYVYFPLGGSRGGKWQSVRNVLLVFLVSGLWHGANWTFLAWGLLNGLYFLPLLVRGRNRAHLDTVAAGRLLPCWRELLQMSSTFLLTLLAWVFFRCGTIAGALHFLASLVSPSLFERPVVKSSMLLPHLAILVAVEWLHRERQHGLELSYVRSRLLRWAVYYALAFTIINVGGLQQQFIYFQF